MATAGPITSDTRLATEEAPPIAAPTASPGTGRRLIRRMRERKSEIVQKYLRTLSTKGRMRKRKAALALSVGAIGFSTSANYITLPEPQPAVADNAEKREHAENLRASETLKEALIEEEGVRYTVYRDVAGYPTVGVGHLVRPGDGLHVGDTVSYDTVLDFLDADIGKAEEAVARLVGDLPLFQHEFDALVDLVYNVGEGNVSSAKSPRLNEAIAQANYDAISDELNYTYAAGSQAAGLVYRSERREKMFLNASYDNPRPAPGEESGEI